jgi:hypothetical protein
MVAQTVRADRSFIILLVGCGPTLFNEAAMRHFC